MSKWRLLDLIEFILSCILIIILSYEIISDYKNNLYLTFELMRNLIWSILFVLYIYQIIINQNRYSFIKDNIIFLIILIPEKVIVRLLSICYLIRTLSAEQVIKLTKCIMILLIIVFIKNIIKRYKKITLQSYAIVGTIITIMFGAMGFKAVEDITFSNALWWSFVTATTVGYGDITPITDIGRVIASILMIGGVVFVSMLTASIVSRFMSGKNKINGDSYKEKMIYDIKESIDDIDNLSDDDIDKICTILKELKSNKIKADKR